MGFASGASESLGPFKPVDDAYVRSDQATANFNSAILYVDKTTSSGGRSEILLKFQVTGTNGRVVAGAVLRLFVGPNSDDGSSYGGDFFPAASNWSEKNVTWNTAPAAGATRLGTLNTRVVSSTWYNVTLSSITGDGIVTLRVTSPSGDGARYSSKEGTNSPELWITVQNPVNDCCDPTAPQNLKVDRVTSSQVDLSWQASTDDTGVDHYEVSRNDTFIRSVIGPSTFYNDTAVNPSNTYVYSVLAVDLVGKRSPPSTQLTVRTPDAPATQTLSFFPTDDAYVVDDSNSPTSIDTNYQKSDPTNLAVDADPFRNILLKFTVTGTGSGQVQSAKLRLFQWDASDKGGDVHRTLSTAWSEQNVTWRNAPGYDPAVVGSIQLDSRVNVYRVVDITQAVAGDGAVSLRITTSSEDAARYYSKEWSTVAQRPMLNVTVVFSRATLTLDVTPNPAPAGTLVAFQGTLLDSSTGSGLSGRAIMIQSLTGGRWLTINTAQVLTLADGSFSTSRAFSSSGAYAVRALFSGDGVYSLTESSIMSESVTGTNPSPPFVFATAGDHDHTSETIASLTALNNSGASFYLGLGDLSYNLTSLTGTPYVSGQSESAWCNYVRSRLRDGFPFEIVSGNHESGAEGLLEEGLIDNFVSPTCLPDRIGLPSYPLAQTYGKEYYFDYPSGVPLARVVMISPGVTFQNGGTYSYVKGTLHYDWLVDAIDGARAVGIPWVIVGMHKVCINMGAQSCEVDQRVMNLLVERRVDLVLQGHDHTYQRTNQLGLNDLTCPAAQGIPIQPSLPDRDCITDDGSDNFYTKGSGTVFVITGIFGAGLGSLNSSDPEAAYFATGKAFGKNTAGNGHGFVKYAVSTDGISAQLVLGSWTTGGPFLDSFTIGNLVRKPSYLTISSTPNPSTDIQHVTVSGLLADNATGIGLDGRTVIIYESVDRIAWTQLAQVSTASDGSYSTSVSFGAGTFYLKSSFAGDSSYEPSESQAITHQVSLSQSFALVVSNEGAVYKLQNSVLTLIFQQNQPLRQTAWKPDGSFALIVGHGGTLLRYDGSQFTQVCVVGCVAGVTTSVNFQAVSWKQDGSYALITGSSGLVLKYDGTSTPIRVAYSGATTTVTLRSISWHPSGTRANLVGDSGTLLVYQSDQLTLASSGTASALYSVAWNPNGLYALMAGDGGTLLRYDASSTPTPINTGVTSLIRAIAWNSAGDLALLSGDSGLLLTYNGISQPSRVNTGTSSNLYGLAWNGASATIVGGSGKMFTYSVSAGLKPVTSNMTSSLRGIGWFPS